ncbi:rRNA maturation RNase YbeY [Roseivivax isoporae]|uniref:Endoribonuclease YbeY n=1 Tax=Roseivivax isoporae LMG 25204 TaxID=1449351 RepID=X7F6M6_9RHOB|nr:rRNA maturation RNase YbeY [Roseivivax isoporae]ETX28388.1 rRNA maturation factor [Roseivivax isoporae LMG 25204]
MLTDTVIEDPRWDAAGLDRLSERAAVAALAHLGLDPAGFEIAVLGCDDARIAELNGTFRGKPQPTNVLSWPAEELFAEADGGAPARPEPGGPHGPAELGDIAIAYDTCLREAEIGGKPLADHVTHLVVHGTLHLLGYDHERDGDATLMETTEAAILAELGVEDPYAPRDGA